MAHRPVSAMSRHETDLINKSRRALASGRVEDSVEKLRHLCLARGASGELIDYWSDAWIIFTVAGILGLGRCFRRIDDNGDKSLSVEEFAKGLHDTGLEVSDEEALEIFNQFDTDGSGSINMTEFLIGIRVRWIIHELVQLLYGSLYNSSLSCRSRARRSSKKRSRSWTRPVTELWLRMTWSRWREPFNEVI